MYTPDWSSISVDVNCPLCDYNLRGLTEPRCPECGYQFQWFVLLDPSQRAHPWLFEHQRRRPVWSFAKTLLEGLRPKTYWTVLKPFHTIRFGRLMSYWALTIFLAVVWVAFALVVRDKVFEMTRSARIPPITWRYVPPKPQPAWALVDARFSPGSEASIAAFAIYELWMGATFLALMIFQISMKRAKVNTSHVVRCIVYSFDLLPWICLWAGVAALLDALLAGTGAADAPQCLAYALVISAISATLLVPYRLYRAYREYLRFDHPFATIFSVQIIVGLLALVILVNVQLALMR